MWLSSSNSCWKLFNIISIEIQTIDSVLEIFLFEQQVLW